MYFTEQKLIEPIKRYGNSNDGPKNIILCHHESTLPILDTLESEEYIQEVTHVRPNKFSTFKHKDILIGLYNVWTSPHIGAHGLTRYYFKGGRNFIDLSALGPLIKI